MGAKVTVAESLEGMACAAGENGEAERAAHLFGAARTLQETTGSQQPPAVRALREPYLTKVRPRLGEAAWEAAFAEGEAMTFEEAVAYALSAEDPDSSPSSISPIPSTEETTVSLTQREREVGALVARGLTNRQIAQELSISERTAANHVAKILRKLGLSSRAQIGALVVEDRPHAPARE